ncbi:MAG: GAF domain-containing protein [Chloroflexota bacterium]|nr:GAF domain-containing protein [Chloroflexota bacterium]
MPAFAKVQAQTQAPPEALPEEHQRFLALQAISSRISAVSDLEQLLDELVQSVRNTFGHTNVHIFLVDEEAEELYLAASGHPLASEVKELRFKIAPQNLLGRVASDGTPSLISDVSQCEFCFPTDPQIRSAMSIPMFVGGHLVGVLYVESDQTDVFEERDLQLMTALANQSAATIEAVRLLQESRSNAMALEQRAHTLMLINRVSTTLNTSMDAYEILGITIRNLMELSDVDYGGALIPEQDRQYGIVVAEHPTLQLANRRLPLPRSPSARRVLEMGIPYAIEDVTNHPIMEHLQEPLPLEFRSLLLVPLVAQQEMIGVLLLASLDQPRTFSDEQMEICQTVASQAAAAVANARLLQDIQQQRRALARKSQEMTEASSKLDAILNNISDGLVVTDPTGHIILNNPAFREMASPPSARSPYGRLLQESFPVAGLQPLIDQALEMPGQIFTENLELPDGRVLKTSATALRIPPPILEPEAGEQIAGAVTVLRDITHEVEVDRMKTDFISTVSHELRSPLTSILGFTRLIQRDFQRRIVPHVASEEKVHQTAARILSNLTIIEGESKRLSQLINDMLDFAKIEADQMEWRMHVTDMAAVIQSGVVATTAMADEKGLSIQIDLPPDGLPPVWGHRDRLVQVIINLLSNAIKFTEQGQIRISGCRLQVAEDEGIQPKPLPLGEWVMVKVTDTGIGIQDKEIPHLFEKFTQIGDTLTEKPPGTGLGLSICKGIIEHHGGYIWTESEPDQGSIFSFVLPVMSLQAEIPRTNTKLAPTEAKARWR